MADVGKRVAGHLASQVRYTRACAKYSMLGGVLLVLLGAAFAAGTLCYGSGYAWMLAVSGALILLGSITIIGWGPVFEEPEAYLGRQVLRALKDKVHDLR